MYTLENMTTTQFFDQCRKVEQRSKEARVSENGKLLHYYYSADLAVKILTNTKLNTQLKISGFILTDVAKRRFTFDRRRRSVCFDKTALCSSAETSKLTFA